MLLKKKGSYDQENLEKLVFCSLILDIHTVYINIEGVLRSPKFKNLVLFNLT